MTLRISSGHWRGRSIRQTASSRVRPTASRIREAVFAILDSPTYCPNWQSLCVLDLFAGSGTLGIEALSNGAKHVTFIEKDGYFCRRIKHSLQDLDVEARATVFRADAVRLPVHLLSAGQINLTFVDPPYEKKLMSASLARLVDTGWLAHGAVIVAESAARDGSIDSGTVGMAGLQLGTERRYGDTLITLMKFFPDVRDEPEVNQIANANAADNSVPPSA